MAEMPASMISHGVTMRPIGVRVHYILGQIYWGKQHFPNEHSGILLSLRAPQHQHPILIVAFGGDLPGS
jgi:hypothetical protein